MNLSNVKSIAIPEGNVSSIAIGGVNVWSAVKQPAIDPNDPWSAVFASIAAGTYKTDYAIGDTVPLDLGSEGVVNMQIAAFDADNKADGSGKAPIRWVSKELLATKYRMNPYLVTNDDGTYQEGTGSIGGWKKCEMRTYLNNTIKPLIPESVRNNIVTVNKSQDANDTTGAKFTQTTEDDVWIPNYEECGSKIKCVVGTSSAIYWWTRNVKSVKNFSTVAPGGNAGNSGNTSDGNYGVALGFCT